MKKLTTVLIALVILSSCQKDYTFKEKDKEVKTAKRDPDTQPNWIQLTTVILYSNYQFDFSWQYQYLPSRGGGSYAVAGMSFNVGGAGQGHTITKYPVQSSISGNVVTFVIRIKDSYMVIIPHDPQGVTNMYDMITMIVKYNFVTKVYTVTYNSHQGW